MTRPPDPIDFPEGTLLVADLHLDVEDQPSLAPLLAFLARITGAPRLVVLGDLFEYWVGPAQERVLGARIVADALARLTSAGTAVDLVPGNRDFLLGAGFERASGARLRPAGLVGRLPGGECVLAVHGDELATRDRAYQRLRRVLRSRAVVAAAPRVPHPLARAAARRMRRASTRAVAAKPAAEKALQAEAARSLAGACGAALLVCGHAHDYRDEALAGGPRWIVLDAFGGPHDVLRVGPGGVEALSSGRL